MLSKFKNMLRAMVRSTAALAAALGWCVLLLTGAWITSLSLSGPMTTSANAALLTVAYVLAWWARGATPVATPAPDPAADAQSAPARQEAIALLERLQVAVEAADIAPWEFDLVSQRFVWLGARLAAFGTEQLTVDDRLEDIQSRMLPEDRNCVIDEPAKAMVMGRDTLTFRYRMHGADGKIHHIQNFVRVQRSPRGTPYRLIGASWDFTEQLEINAKLQERAEHESALIERLSMASECAGIGFWEMDLVAQRFSWVDNPVRSLGRGATGFGSLEEFAQLVVPEDRLMLPDSIKRCLKDGTRRFELRYRFNSPITGTVVHIQTFGRVMTNETGRPVRALGVSWDVTKEVLAAGAALRTEAAEAANAAKSSFLINMSHEIRTPINGILGMTSLLLDTQLDSVQRDYAATIHGSGESLVAIVNDILDLSKIEAGKLELESAQVDLRRLVEEVGAVMGCQATAKGIDLVLDIADELDTLAYGDAHRLRQCLLNLLGNAVKFTSSGEIVVKVNSQGALGEQQLIQFEVVDTGMGIDADTLQSLFQPLVQADSSITRRFGGTGLGLSIVRRLVEMMGGEVSVASEPGRGSAFTLRIPMRLVPRVADAEAEKSAEAAARVLVVDENATLRRTLAARLDYAGHHVTTACSAEEALQVLHATAKRDESFDVVLYDAALPPMDAAAFDRGIGLAPIALVLLQDPNRESAVRRGAAEQAHLIMPLRRERLLGCIAEIVRARSLHHRARRSEETEPLIERTLSGAVLLVEDNVVNQKVARRILERMGCNVHVANDGLEGVEQFARQHFDLVLMDLQMPVLDGFAATRRIRALAGGSMVPIVALTANATRGESDRCTAEGMNAFLTKPINVRQLQSTLARLGLASRAATATSQVAENSQGETSLA
jgi:signal transduction histidine kinase/DNA-binding response OmpR family regulator